MRQAIANEAPSIDIGKQCRIPYDCDFHGHCWAHIPGSSVFDLKGKGVDKFDLYRRRIIRMEDIPIDLLNFHQRTQLEGTLDKKNYINSRNISDFLKQLQYPLAFLDFETIMPAIPPFFGTRPYQQIPYQFSLHVVENDEADPVHYEYLAEPGIDPRKELVEQLLSSLPSTGSILTYGSFESERLNDLADWFPAHADRISSILGRTVNLMTPFLRKDVYLWPMNGSYSIKNVLPAIMPELSYSQLEISDGNMAIAAYYEMCAARGPGEAEKIRKCLLEYCGLDTLGMIEIVNYLKSIT